MFKKGILIVVLILLFGTIFYLFYTHKQEINLVQNIEFEKDDCCIVNLESLFINLDLLANIAFSDTVKLSFKVGGELEKGEVELELGNSFKKNQLLFQINNKKAFLSYLEAKNQFRSTSDDAIKILEKLLLTKEIVKWKEFSTSLGENQLIADFPLSTNSEEQKIVQNLNLSKSYHVLKSLESGMANYFYLAPFEGKVLKLYSSIGTKIQKNQIVALLVSKNAKILQVIMDSAEFNEIVSVQKVFVESTDFVQKLDWNTKIIVKNGSKVTLLFKDKSWNRIASNKVFRFILQGKTEKKYAWIQSSFIENKKVKSTTSKSLVTVQIHKTVKDASLVTGLKAGMKIIR